MTTAPLVLAVDDEPRILTLMRWELTEQGFRVITASRAEEARKQAEEHQPAVILLDIALPDGSGLDLMEELREVCSARIILVTGKATVRDKVGGLGLGADDYIIKPFSLEELAARVRAVLRRAPSIRPLPFRTENVEIDLDKHLVKKNGDTVSLSRSEWLLLQPLVANAGKTLLNNELLAEAWGPGSQDQVGSLRVWISRLRHKLEEDPKNPTLIRTVQGNEGGRAIGYVIKSSWGQITEAPVT